MQKKFTERRFCLQRKDSWQSYCSIGAISEPGIRPDTFCPIGNENRNDRHKIKFLPYIWFVYTFAALKNIVRSTPQWFEVKRFIQDFLANSPGVLVIRIRLTWQEKCQRENTDWHLGAGGHGISVIRISFLDVLIYLLMNFTLGI